MMARASEIEVSLPYAIGLFAAAYAVGFLVLFVPAGLGVRDAILVVGLLAEATEAQALVVVLVVVVGGIVVVVVVVVVVVGGGGESEVSCQMSTPTREAAITPRTMLMMVIRLTAHLARAGGDQRRAGLGSANGGGSR